LYIKQKKSEGKNYHMKFKTLIGLIASGQLALLLQLGPIFRQAYRSSFVAAALSEGIFTLLREGPINLDQLHQRIVGFHSGESPSGENLSKERLKTWLGVGVSLGDLKLTPDGYALRSRLSRQLAQLSNDGIAAMYQEVYTLHHNLITQTPARLREKRLFMLSDTDGDLIARSSRILEPYILEIVDSVVPENSEMNLLEVGCGSGVYIWRACLRNPELHAVGLELQPNVADLARKNLQLWGVSDRVRVDTGDIRNFTSSERFDLVTLHNNIYYFPIPERPDLIRRLGNFLNPGGKLLVTTACQGYPSTEMLNLWGQMTEGMGALPKHDDLCALMSQAGLVDLRKTELLPGSGFFAYEGTRR
jgi:4-hydroxy-2,2'-bipyrrole-5-carbaldehyde O-methyltransferase